MHLSDISPSASPGSYISFSVKRASLIVSAFSFAVSEGQMLSKRIFSLVDGFSIAAAAFATFSNSSFLVSSLVRFMTISRAAVLFSSFLSERSLSIVPQSASPSCSIRSFMSFSLASAALYLSISSICM